MGFLLSKVFGLEKASHFFFILYCNYHLPFLLLRFSLPIFCHKKRHPASPVNTGFLGCLSYHFFKNDVLFILQMAFLQVQKDTGSLWQTPQDSQQDVRFLVPDDWKTHLGY